MQASNWLLSPHFHQQLTWRFPFFFPSIPTFFAFYFSSTHLFTPFSRFYSSEWSSDPSFKVSLVNDVEITDDGNIQSVHRYLFKNLGEEDSFQHLDLSQYSYEEDCRRIDHVKRSNPLYMDIGSPVAACCRSSCRSRATINVFLWWLFSAPLMSNQCILLWNISCPNRMIERSRKKA